MRTSAAHLALRAPLHPVLAWPLRGRGSLPLRALLRQQLLLRYLSFRLDLGDNIVNLYPHARPPNRRHPPRAHRSGPQRHPSDPSEIFRTRTKFRLHQSNRPNRHNTPGIHQTPTPAACTTTTNRMMRMRHVAGPYWPPGTSSTRSTRVRCGKRASAEKASRLVSLFLFVSARAIRVTSCFLLRYFRHWSQGGSPALPQD